MTPGDSVNHPTGPPDRAVHPKGVTLAHLLAELPGAIASGPGGPADADLVLTGVHQDSRRVGPGDVFVARKGRSTNGEAFVKDAIRRGASAVLLERGSAALADGVVAIEVDDPARVLGFAAAAVYGHPTFALDVVGVTGTNGKTTTTHLVRAAVEAAGYRCGVIGTLGASFEGDVIPSPHTNPEADELARLAAAFKERGATHLAMEVSSIGLAAFRAEAVRYRVAAFTNLTQDHLDYHGTMEAYGLAKARLFLELGAGSSAIMVDDPFGAALADRVHARFAEHALLRVSPAKVPGADVYPIERSVGTAGIELRVRSRRGEANIRSPLVGAHNVKNLLLALAIADLLDLPLDRAAEGLSSPVVVPGRMERCDDPTADDVVVIVDYAHTPDALVRVLESARPFARTALVCVFGCGGDRDPAKRPLMGEAVRRGADRAIVTSDNPRSEDPRAIVDAILPGIPGAIVELDRAAAIERAILEAVAGDVVLVAGKGHETYQIMGGQTIAFDDREHARRALASRRSRRGATA